jgi:two-component system response regulator
MKDRFIMVVEDNPDDEELTLRALRSANLANQLVLARDGVEALDFLFGTGKHAGRDTSAMPCVVLLDLKLPKVDGIEVLKRLRANERTRSLPVVVLTSSNEQKDVVASYQFGTNSYVRKPVNFGEFSKAVSELGLYWFLLNEYIPPSSAR